MYSLMFLALAYADDVRRPSELNIVGRVCAVLAIIADFALCMAVWGPR